MKKNILFIIIGVVLVIGFFVFYCSNKPKLWNDKLWQAVFLTNNQVYFGKIEKISKDTISLSHIYYLQASDDLSSDENTSKLNLIKLGSEVHGPEDVMIISRQNVLFWENLKNDSKIVNIINNYR